MSFVGDGMGVTTTSMARIFKAQERNLTGSEAFLSWEHFPYSSIARVGNVFFSYVKKEICCDHQENPARSSYFRRIGVCTGDPPSCLVFADSPFSEEGRLEPFFSIVTPDLGVPSQ